MKKVIIYIIFILSVFIIGCSDETSDNSCSPANPTGECVDGYSCISGSCKLTCSDTTPCPNLQVCHESICYDTTKICSRSNPFGYCESSYETCVDGFCVNNQPCSESNPNGVCQIEGSICYEGVCYEATDQCTFWNPGGSCPTGYRCVAGSCKYNKPDWPCRPDKPNGTCFDETNICLEGVCVDPNFLCGCAEGIDYCPPGQLCQDGECKIVEDNPCNGENLYGYCPNDQICYGGVCYDLDQPCSETNIYGTCPNEGELCVGGVCEYYFKECDNDNPDFNCPDSERQTCVDYRCVDNDLECSSENPEGYCPELHKCVDGICVEVTLYCSSSNPNGVCELDHQFCNEGVCVDRYIEDICSETNLEGNCPNGQICQNGVCQGTIISRGMGYSCLVDNECIGEMHCDRSFIKGYCTLSCSDQNPCPNNSYCFYKNEQDETGVCLSNCSLDLPNSCNRDQYICIPTGDDELGGCLYDCSYHNCFETGLTCNSETGICD